MDVADEYFSSPQRFSTPWALCYILFVGAYRHHHASCVSNMMSSSGRGRQALLSLLVAGADISRLLDSVCGSMDKCGAKLILIEIQSMSIVVELRVTLI